MNNEKHLFVEDDILAQKSINGDFDEPMACNQEPETLKDLPFWIVSQDKEKVKIEEMINDGEKVILLDDVKQLIIKWINILKGKNIVIVGCDFDKIHIMINKGDKWFFNRKLSKKDIELLIKFISFYNNISEEDLKTEEKNFLI